MLRTLLLLLFLISLNDSPTSFSPSDFDQSSSILGVPDVHPVPVLKSKAFAPDIKAKAGLIMDYDTGLILYEKNIHTILPMASLTKIMTAILILENHDLSEPVTVQSSINVEGVHIGLRKGEQWTVEDLLKALLIPSAGDAAVALAEFHSGTVEKFVDVMNQKAKTLNLLHTHFINPIGLDANDHYSTAYDLAILTKYALHFPDFRAIVEMSEATVHPIRGASRDFNSTNYLLKSYLHILGVKTGTTDAAGESLINLAQNDDGHRIIAVLLNSPNRFQENKSMIDWAFRSYEW